MPKSFKKGKRCRGEEGGEERVDPVVDSCQNCHKMRKADEEVDQSPDLRIVPPVVSLPGFSIGVVRGHVHSRRHKTQHDDGEGACP